MRAHLQRVTRARVSVDNVVVGEIGAGLLVLLGVAHNDSEDDLDYLVDKTIGLRIFEDTNGKMNVSLKDTGGEMLVVSQFTLMADCRKGRRPSFVAAAAPDVAREYYEAFANRIEQLGIAVARGQFAAHMHVELVNDGPVTILLDSDRAG